MPGQVRLIIELAFTALAVWACWNVAPILVAPEAEDAGAGATGGAGVVILLSLAFGYNRLMWLARGAPPAWPPDRTAD